MNLNTLRLYYINKAIYFTDCFLIDQFFSEIKLRVFLNFVIKCNAI